MSTATYIGINLVAVRLKDARQSLGHCGAAGRAPIGARSLKFCLVHDAAGSERAEAYDV